MATDLGDVVPLAVTVKDSSGTAANTTTVSCTITLPDLTTTTTSVTNATTGSYTATYTPTPVSYTHLTLPTIHVECRSRWSPYH